MTNLKQTSKIRWLIVFALLSTLTILQTCTKKEQDVVKIGAVLVMSGSGAEYGIDAQRGIDLAVDQLNAKGGIRGKMIKVIYEDNQGEPSSSVSAMQKLISKDNIQVVIGAMYSSNTLAAAPVAEKNKVVLFSPAASSPDLTDAGDYIFRNWPSDVFEGGAVAQFAYDSLGLRKIAIIGVLNDYGVGLKKVFTKRFETLGGIITRFEGYNKDDSDFRTQLTKVTSGEIEGIYLPGYYNEIGQLLRQARNLGIETQFLSCVSFEDPKVLEIAVDAAEGVIYGVPAFDSKSEEPIVKEFVTDFQNKYQREPGVFAAHAYDALKIVMTAIEAGGTTSEGIKEALYNIRDFEGVTGLTNIDMNGDVSKPIRIKIVRNGLFSDY